MAGLFGSQLGSLPSEHPANMAMGTGTPLDPRDVSARCSERRGCGLAGRGRWGNEKQGELERNRPRGCVFFLELYYMLSFQCRFNILLIQQLVDVSSIGFISVPGWCSTANGTEGRGRCQHGGIFGGGHPGRTTTCATGSGWWACSAWGARGSSAVCHLEKCFFCLSWILMINIFITHINKYMGTSQNTRYGSRPRTHTRSIPPDPYLDPYPMILHDPYPWSIPLIHTPDPYLFLVEERLMLALMLLFILILLLVIVLLLPLLLPLFLLLPPLPPLAASDASVLLLLLLPLLVIFLPGAAATAVASAAAPAGPCSRCWCWFTSSVCFW